MKCPEEDYRRKLKYFGQKLSKEILLQGKEAYNRLLMKDFRVLRRGKPRRASESLLRVNKSLDMKEEIKYHNLKASYIPSECKMKQFLLDFNSFLAFFLWNLTLKLKIHPPHLFSTPHSIKSAFPKFHFAWQGLTAHKLYLKFHFL